MAAKSMVYFSKDITEQDSKIFSKYFFSGLQTLNLFPKLFVAISENLNLIEIYYTESKKDQVLVKNVLKTLFSTNIEKLTFN